MSMQEELEELNESLRSDKRNLAKVTSNRDRLRSWCDEKDKALQGSPPIPLLQGSPPIPLLPVPIASHTDNVSHPSALQYKPTITPTQPPKPQQPKPKPQSGGLERCSAVFRIDSKVFSLACDGGKIDFYAIHERRGKFHGSIRVGRLGLDWIIACLAALDQWNFRKQPFFKRLRENSKLLEFTSRLNKGGLFVEISEYHNGARKGCLRVLERTKIGGWTLFGRKLRDYFLGKKTAGPKDKVVTGGREFEKAVDRQKSQVWKKVNGHENKGSNLRFVKHLPNITGQHNQFESLGGFSVSKKSISANALTAGRPVRASHLKWTQAHFCLKISIDLVGEGKRTVSWGKIQPIVSRPAQAHQPNRENGSGQPSFDISRHVCIGNGSNDLQTHEWVTEEGSGTHEDEEEEIPSFGEGLGGSPVDDMKSDEELTHKEEVGEVQSSGERLSGPLVTDTKPNDRVSGSDDHNNAVEAVLSADSEPAHSLVVAGRRSNREPRGWVFGCQYICWSSFDTR
ncbi:hypothetical protein SO802_031770 [Lithocarpus litseifolius]|uniref:Uncharacterized protein n=1 Tax=Lithocarpus litseifolius TaxID=425828 RepID=A0AAW2BPI3_9ROSI